MAKDVEITDFEALAEARRAVREIGHKAGFGSEDLRPVINIVSELGVFAIQSRRAERMTLNEVSRPDCGGICIVARISDGGGEGALADLSYLSTGGMKGLSDQFEISQRNGETIIHAVKWRPSPGERRQDSQAQHSLSEKA